MKQSLDTRTKLLTQNPVSLMFELSILLSWHGGCWALQLYGFGFRRVRWSALYRWELSRYPIHLP